MKISHKLPKKYFPKCPKDYSSIIEQTIIIVHNMLKEVKKHHKDFDFYRGNWKIVLDNSDLKVIWIYKKRIYRYSAYALKVSGRYNYFIFSNSWQKDLLKFRGKESNFIESISYIQHFMSYDDIKLEF